MLDLLERHSKSCLPWQKLLQLAGKWKWGSKTRKLLRHFCFWLSAKHPEAQRTGRYREARSMYYFRVYAHGRLVQLGGRCTYFAGSFMLTAAATEDVVPSISGTVTISSVISLEALKADTGEYVHPRCSIPATNKSPVQVRKKPIRSSVSIAFRTSTAAFMTRSVSLALYILQVHKTL